MHLSISYFPPALECSWQRFLGRNFGVFLEHKKNNYTQFIRTRPVWNTDSCILMRHFRNWSSACIAFFLLIPLRYNQLATYMFENVYRTCQRQNGVERTGRTWSFPQDWEGWQTECNDTDSCFVSFPDNFLKRRSVDVAWRCLTAKHIAQRGFVPALEIVLTFSSLGLIFVFVYSVDSLSWFSRYAGEVLPWTCSFLMEKKDADEDLQFLIERRTFQGGRRQKLSGLII